MKLNEIKDNNGARYVAKRLGRGIGSGKGKTCGKGHKGQKARSGIAIKGFEGGQMPIYRRLPKRGFNSLNPTIYATVNLYRINQLIDSKKIDANALITIDTLLDVGLVRTKRLPLKILATLATGELTHKIEIQADSFSQSAQEKIQKSGGKVVLTDKCKKVVAKNQDRVERAAKSRKERQERIQNTIGKLSSK